MPTAWKATDLPLRGQSYASDGLVELTLQCAQPAAPSLHVASEFANFRTRRLHLVFMFIIGTT